MCKFHAHVERVRRVGVELELRPEFERALPEAMAVAVVNMQPGGRHLDPEVRIAHLRCNGLDLCGRVGKRMFGVHRHQCIVQSLGQCPLARRCMHDAARPIGLAHRAARVRADLGGQHRRDVQLGGDAEQQRIDAARVGLGEFGQVAHAHHDRCVGKSLAQPVVADDRCGQAERNRVEDGVGEKGTAAFAQPLDGLVKRRFVARRTRDQHRRGRHLVRNPQRVERQTEQVVGAGASAAQQLAPIDRVDADREAFRLQGPNAALQVCEFGFGQAAQVDHVGAVGSQRTRPLDDLRYRQAWRVDDLGKDRDLVFAQVDRLGGTVEKARQVLQLFGAALHRNAVVRAQGVAVAPAAAGHDDAVGALRCSAIALAQHRCGDAAANHVGRHQRSHLQADFAHLPGERRSGDARQHTFELGLCEPTGQEDDVFHLTGGHTVACRENCDPS